jgi:hypothetical protein
MHGLGTTSLSCSNMTEVSSIRLWSFHKLTYLYFNVLVWLSTGNSKELFKHNWVWPSTDLNRWWAPVCVNKPDVLRSHTACERSTSRTHLSDGSKHWHCQFAYYKSKYRGLCSAKLWKWRLCSDSLETHSEPKTNKTKNKQTLGGFPLSVKTWKRKDLDLKNYHSSPCWHKLDDVGWWLKLML